MGDLFSARQNADLHFYKQMDPNALKQEADLVLITATQLTLQR